MDVRTSVARGMIATAINAIRAINLPRKTARPPRPQAKPAPARSASIIGAAAATMSSASRVTDTPAVAASADGAPAPAEARPDQRNDRGRPPRERFEGKDREKGDRPKFGGNRDGDRNKGDRNKGGRDFGGRDKGGRDKRDSGPSHRQWATSAAPRERDRPIDPNSPFAKLAALKEQLAGNRKD